MDGTRIANERKKLGLSQEELAGKVGVSQKSISKYERGTRRPSYETLTAMANLFGVTVGYLLGNSDAELREGRDEQEYSFFFFDDLLRDVFSSRCNDLLREKRLSVNSLADVTGIDAERCRKYLRGECEPSLEDLISIAQALETTTDYLLGQTPKVTYYENKILGPFVKLNADNKDILIGKAKELLREQEVAVAADSQPLRKASGK